MEVLIDIRIQAQDFFRDVVTQFGYFKKITGDSNQNLSYIKNATKVEFSMTPSEGGIRDGLSIKLKHGSFGSIDKARQLLLSLVDTMVSEFETFKRDRGLPRDCVKVEVDLNLATCGDCGFMTTTFQDFEDHVKRDHEGLQKTSKSSPWKREKASPPRSRYVKTPRQVGGRHEKSSDKKFSPYQAAKPKAETSFRPSFSHQGSAFNDKKPAKYEYDPNRQGPEFKMYQDRKPGNQNGKIPPKDISRNRVNNDSNKFRNGESSNSAAQKYEQKERDRRSGAITTDTFEREEKLLGRRLEGNLGNQETLAVILQLKRKFTDKEAKLVAQQIDETRKIMRVNDNDFQTLQLKILVSAIKRKAHGLSLESTGKLQTSSSLKSEMGQVLQRITNNQISEKMIRNIIRNYEDHYIVTQEEKKMIEEQVTKECKAVQGQSGGYPNSFAKSVVQFRMLQKVLMNKVELACSILVNFDPITYLRKNEESSRELRSDMSFTRPGRSMDSLDGASSAEKTNALQDALQKLLKRRGENNLTDNLAESISEKLTAAISPNAGAEMALRKSWEVAIERLRFVERREPSRFVKVSMMLNTVVQYVLQELQNRNVNNSKISRMLDILKACGAGPGGSNVPVFPILENPDASMKDLQTRLSRMTDQISNLLQKRKSHRLPDREVQTIVRDIAQGIPSAFYEQIYAAYDDMCLEIERMGGKSMNESRKLTCLLQVLCTYGRHYLMEKLPEGSPLHPKIRKNPFKYIEYGNLGTSPRKSAEQVGKRSRYDELMGQPPVKKDRPSYEEMISKPTKGLSFDDMQIKKARSNYQDTLTRPGMKGKQRSYDDMAIKRSRPSYEEMITKPGLQGKRKSYEHTFGGTSVKKGRPSYEEMITKPGLQEKRGSYDDTMVRFDSGTKRPSYEELMAGNKPQRSRYDEMKASIGTPVAGQRKGLEDFLNNAIETCWKMPIAQLDRMDRQLMSMIPMGVKTSLIAHRKRFEMQRNRPLTVRERLEVSCKWALDNISGFGF